MDQTDDLLAFLNSLATVRMMRDLRRRARIDEPTVEITDWDIVQGVIYVE